MGFSTYDGISGNTYLAIVLFITCDHLETPG